MRRETTVNGLTLHSRDGNGELVRRQFRQPGPVNNETGNVSRSLTRCSGKIELDDNGRWKIAKECINWAKCRGVVSVRLRGRRTSSEERRYDDG